jgi:hypothetical protein
MRKETIAALACGSKAHASASVQSRLRGSKMQSCHLPVRWFNIKKCCFDAFQGLERTDLVILYRLGMLRMFLKT